MIRYPHTINKEILIIRIIYIEDETNMYAIWEVALPHKEGIGERSDVICDKMVFLSVYILSNYDF